MHVPAFLDQLVDWQDFELFVRDMYAQDADLVVEHNVTEKGRSGAPRQTDVKFTHRVAGMAYTTLVECKKWKQKITRDRIDVLATSVEDLGASKGVMFTTTGYEPGAEAYARHKGIELFVVRDLLDDEWGAPGRVVSFWMHYYNAGFDKLSTKAMLLNFLPEPVQPKLDIRLTPEGVLDDKLTLVSSDAQQRGPNLLSVLIEARTRVLDLVSKGIPTLIGDGQDGSELALRVPVEINFSRSSTRSLVVEGGRLDIESMSGDFLVTVMQQNFKHDRGQNLNLALAVEHLMTRQRQVVVRPKVGEGVGVYELQDRSEVDDAVTPDTLFRLFLEPWVGLGEVKAKVVRGNAVRFELPDWTTRVTERPQFAHDLSSSSETETEHPGPAAAPRPEKQRKRA
jgi:hypothetical protein